MHSRRCHLRSILISSSVLSQPLEQRNFVLYVLPPTLLHKREKVFLDRRICCIWAFPLHSLSWNALSIDRTPTGHHLKCSFLNCFAASDIFSLNRKMLVFSDAWSALHFFAASYFHSIIFDYCLYLFGLSCPCFLVAKHSFNWTYFNWPQPWFTITCFTTQSCHRHLYFDLSVGHHLLRNCYPSHRSKMNFDSNRHLDSSF